MTSILPAFLTADSPPRSPHIERPTFFSSYFASRSGGSSTAPTGPSPHSPPRASQHGLRPTRRDALLCLLTLSFAYLLFSSPPTSDPVALASSTSRYRLLEWGSWRSSTVSANSCALLDRSPTFMESVKPAGFELPADDTAELGKQWDGGEEEAEDDEFEGVSTVLKGHAPGWTLFDKLYIYNGSFFVVTDYKEDWPELRMMTSTGLPANNEPGNSEAREPKGDEILYITPAEAAKLWGPRVYRMDGMTFLFNDGQFIDHYYHFAAELLLGAWRAYTSLDQDITGAGETSLPPPSRAWFLHQSVSEWRDTPRFNPTIMFAIFPSISILYPDDFEDMARQTHDGQPKAFVLDSALLADRSAAFRGEWTGPTARTVASAVHVGTTSRWWWEPIRRTVLRYSGVPESVIARNLEGYGAMEPELIAGAGAWAGAAAGANGSGAGVSVVEPLAPQGTYTPVITYISRQNSRRRLTPESHEDLVKALEARAKKLGWELVVVEAEKMTKEEQFALAGRTTIMLGVHGNGLTHLLWMPATPRSAVIEMFFPGGFARDYQWTAHTLGIRHFAIHYNISFTAPNIPLVDYPEGFQGTGITVVGEFVADLIEDRLAGRV